MASRVRTIALTVLLILTPFISPAQTGLQANRPTSTKSVGAFPLTERQRALHALDRLTFGPRPGDLKAVMAEGVDSWIEDQLHPESIDDSALNAHLGPYVTTRMSLKQLAESFPSDNAIAQIVSGKRQLPTDPVEKMIYAVQVARIEQQKASQIASEAGGSQSVKPGAETATDAAPSQDKARAAAQAIAESLLAMPKEQRLAELENTRPEQLIDFPNLLRADQRDRLNADFSPQERDFVRALAVPRNVVANELQQAKLIREIYSERQLLEVMTDFWVNHFNVFQYKDQCVYYTTAYERDTIRPHALGKFYDLLVATAQSPAMLAYLDNWVSIGPHSQAAEKSGRGLNENYGRELMELHTLGVDGGYTQSDVTELARVLTGWTIAQPADDPQFKFDPRRHEPGVKTVLGEKFYEAGSDEGLRALDMIAHQPATAHFISQSIATRFVSDNPPESLVRRMATSFTSSDGDIREVMRTMLRSPEFWSPKTYRAKLKTPLEFIVSSVRASGANVSTPDALVQILNAMGMRPYGMETPTGYPMKANAWGTEGALLARVNFSTALTQNKLPGVQFDPANLVTLGLLENPNLPNPEQSVRQDSEGVDLAIAFIEDAMLHGALSPTDRAVIRKQMGDPEAQRELRQSPISGLRQVAAFVLASPDFQQR